MKVSEGQDCVASEYAGATLGFETTKTLVFNGPEIGVKWTVKIPQISHPFLLKLQLQLLLKDKKATSKRISTHFEGEGEKIGKYYGCSSML